MENAEIPYSRNMESTYENFLADCPNSNCGVRNTFNRASDLQTFKPIGFKTVTCQACKQPFNINNDTVNAAHDMLLLGCFAFIERKEYMQCVLSVAQAYEVFFSHFLHVQLIYRPYANDGSRNLSHLNRLLQQLYDRIHLFTFVPMRCLVLRLLVGGIPPASLAAAEVEIKRLLKRPQDVHDPAAPKKTRAYERKDILMPDGPLKELLLRLLDADVNELRNLVVHKDAYRPTREEATRVHKEAREVLHGLTARLGLGYDINWYMSEAGR